MENSNEALEQVCIIRRRFDDLISRHSDDSGAFADCVKSALASADFPSEEQIRNEYKKSADSARILRIGIVGAVKAGKSSLINSLFFKGRDILPKAATPMTAALTEITYGKEYSVTVEFFSDKDIQELRSRAAEYERKFEQIKSDKLKEIEGNWRKKLGRLMHEDVSKVPDRLKHMLDGEPGAEDRKKWEEMAERAAKTKLKESLSLSGAYDQYQMIMKKAKFKKTGSNTFKVNSVSALADCLKPYVSADGNLMPFTSRVSIELPFESLEGISVVDTPGFNDPVPSRDDRARLALRDCDAVFILSRATPFLTRADMEVISKITLRNGLHEIYIVPSQVDSTLIAQEIISDSDEDIDKALEIVTEKLCRSVSKNIGLINESGVFDQLIDESSDRMFLTSGMCESMALTFDERESWDSEKKNAWQNLCESYPNTFSDMDEGTSKDWLKKLGNIERISDSINEVKERKSEIFHKSLEHFGQKYAAAAKEARDFVLRDIKQRENDILANDIGKTEEEIKLLQDSYNSLRPDIQDAFRETLSKWYIDVRSSYARMLSGSRQDVNKSIDNQEGETTRTRIEKSGWWIFGSETEHKDTITTANVTQVKNAIEDYIEDYNDLLPHFINDQVLILISKVTNSVQKKWSENTAISGYSASAFRNRVRTGIENVIGHKEYDLDYKGEKFSYSSDHSTVEGAEAEEFISEARGFVSQLNRNFREMLRGAMEDVYKKCVNCQFAQVVLDPFIKQLEAKKKEMEQPKASLENCRRIREELEAILK